MHEGVSDILVARARELDDLTRPLTMSFAVHAALLGTLIFLPAAWFAGKPPEKLMIISLGSGVVGPAPTGMTALGGKKVDEVVPPTKRPEPILPAAPVKSTAMTEPVKATVKPPPPSKAAKTAPPAPPAKATGAQLSQGSAVAATTATGQGVGLSVGGQGGDAFDSNWCCPDWTNALRSKVAETWNEHLGMAGTTVVEFVVARDGSISGVQVITSSGNAQLDMNSRRAVETAKLPPLPPAYTPNRLTITLKFPYIK